MKNIMMNTLSLINKLLSKNFKVRAVYLLLILCVPFQDNFKTNPSFAASFILFVLLMGLEKEEKEELFEGMQPFEIFMPLFVTIIFYFIVSRLKSLF